MAPRQKTTIERALDVVRDVADIASLCARAAGELAALASAGGRAELGRDLEERGREIRRADTAEKKEQGR